MLFVLTSLQRKVVDVDPSQLVHGKAGMLQ